MRLFTASEVDCMFCPVTRCRSTTTCTASSLLAAEQKKGGVKSKILGLITVFVRRGYVTCVRAAIIFDKILDDQRQVGKVGPPHEFKHWRLPNRQQTNKKNPAVSKRHQIWWLWDVSTCDSNSPLLSCNRRISTSAPRWRCTEPRLPVRLHKLALHTQTHTTRATVVLPFFFFFLNVTQTSVCETHSAGMWSVWGCGAVSRCVPGRWALRGSPVWAAPGSERLQKGQRDAKWAAAQTQARRSRFSKVQSPSIDSSLAGVA